jgi:ribosomal protein S18 acetylase RimI-like enzyme
MTTWKLASGWCGPPTSTTATPTYLGGSTRSFLRRPSPLGARVAELDRTIVGQVGLRPAASKAVMTLACDRLKVTADQIGVVARLLVSPQQRRQGAGSKLLNTAVTEAQALRLRPVLDVDINLTAAIALYERTGWQRIGEASIDLPDGTSLHEAVYTLNFNLAAT